MRYAVVIENSDHNGLAYVPDLPGCVATGRMGADALTPTLRAQYP
jgi:predicted RNase H-like HicB family nuclease